MEWVSSWIQGIIISVIISTIIEMILPEGNSKKYIKVVIGVYILFTIVSPIITKVTGTKFKLSDIVDLNEYVEASSKTSHQNLEKNQDLQIKNVYEVSLKNDMQKRIEAKGYKVVSIFVKLEKEEPYTLRQINLELIKEEQVLTSNVQTVNEIKVQIENNTRQEKKQETLSILEQKQLKQYLSSIYEIEEKNININ